MATQQTHHRTFAENAWGCAIFPSQFIPPLHT